MYAVVGNGGVRSGALHAYIRPPTSTCEERGKAIMDTLQWAGWLAVYHSRGSFFACSNLSNVGMECLMMTMTMTTTILISKRQRDIKGRERPTGRIPLDVLIIVAHIHVNFLKKWNHSLVTQLIHQAMAYITSTYSRCN